MVGAHARGADTAKGQGGDGKVHDAVVGDVGARCGLVADLLERGRVVGKVVEGEGAVAAVDKVDGVVEGLLLDDGQDGAKDLVLHHERVGADVGQDRGGNVLCGLVDLTADGHGAAGQEGLEAVEVVAVDDAGKAGRVLGVLAVKLEHGGLDLGQELGLVDAVEQDDIVGGDADLAGVKVLAVDEAARGDVQVRRLVDDGGALSAELERDGAELLGGGAHDDAADRAVARVKDVVPLLLEQLGRLGDGAVHDLVGGVVKVLGEELGEEFGAVGRNLDTR